MPPCVPARRDAERAAHDVYRPDLARVGDGDQRDARRRMAGRGRSRALSSRRSRRRRRPWPPIRYGSSSWIVTMMIFVSGHACFVSLSASSPFICGMPMSMSTMLGVQREREPHGLLSVSGFPDHLGVGIALEHPPDRASESRVVVSNQQCRHLAPPSPPHPLSAGNRRDALTFRPPLRGVNPANYPNQPRK